MKYRSANNISLQNALIVSIIVHGAGIYIMLIWTTVHKPHVLEFKPIPITKIIYESSLEPRVEKVVAPVSIPVEKIFTKANAMQNLYPHGPARK